MAFDPPADLLVFDLDGTLIDSLADLAAAVNQTLADLDRPPLPLTTVARYVGDGARMLIRRSLGSQASEADADRALERFYRHYGSGLLEETRLYPGAEEALKAFARAGKRLAVLTNKPERFSAAIVEGLGCGTRFERIYGGDSFSSKKPDPEGLRRIISETGAAPERTLMIGDSAVDIRTARNAGVRSCGVTFGLRPESFEQEPPDFYANSFAELKDLVLGNSESEPRA